MFNAIPFQGDNGVGVVLAQVIKAWIWQIEDWKGVSVETIEPGSEYSDLGIWYNILAMMFCIVPNP